MYNAFDTVMLAKKITDRACYYINESLKKYNITLTQFIFMMYIYNHTNSVTTLKDLAKCYELSHVTVIGIIRRMEKNGLIITMINPDDKRSRLVMLKQKGIELCNKVVIPSDVIDKNMNKVLGVETTENLKNILNDMYLNFDKIFVDENQKEEEVC